MLDSPARSGRARFEQPAPTSSVSRRSARRATGEGCAAREASGRPAASSAPTFVLAAGARAVLALALSGGAARFRNLFLRCRLHDMGETAHGGRASSSAVPPVRLRPMMGWAAAAGEMGFQLLILCLCLVIFIWTPRHLRRSVGCARVAIAQKWRGPSTLCALSARIFHFVPIRALRRCARDTGSRSIINGPAQADPLASRSAQTEFLQSAGWIALGSPESQSSSSVRHAVPVPILVCVATGVPDGARQSNASQKRRVDNQVGSTSDARQRCHPSKRTSTAMPSARRSAAPSSRHS